MIEKTSSSKEKKLKHVKVYDTLYEQIQNGTYPIGSQLPSETVLAEQMGVSRMTLRKALALFIEDGLIKNVPGVGHFICEPKKKNTKDLDLYKTKHPIYDYCTETLDSTEIDFRLEPPTKSILDTLGQYTPVIVIADRWYKKENIPIAYSLSFIPIEVISKKQIDLTHPEELLAYLESECYTEMASGHRICSHSTTGNFTAKKYTLSDHDSFLLVQETISDKDGKVLISNKHYIPSELYQIDILL